MSGSRLKISKSARHISHFFGHISDNWGHADFYDQTCQVLTDRKKWNQCKSRYDENDDDNFDDDDEENYDNVDDDDQENYDIVNDDRKENDDTFDDDHEENDDQRLRGQLGEPKMRIVVSEASG